MSGVDRILALDYGTKRVGVAMSDALGAIAQPVETIAYKNPSELWLKLDKITNLYSVKKFVLGMPLSMDGRKTAAAEAVKAFASQLSQRYLIPVEFWDERLSSQVAEKTIRSLGKKPSRNKELVDKVAAAWILQGYLDRINQQYPTP